MPNSSAIEESARREIAGLLAARRSLSRELERLRARREVIPAHRMEALDEKTLRCERLTFLLDTRIRLAAEVLAGGEVTPGV